MNTLLGIPAVSDITKIRKGQYIALDKVESICNAMECTPDEMMEFVPDDNTVKED